MHSVSIYGLNDKKIPEHLSKSSFGKKSTWEWICNRKDICNLSIGVSVAGGATFLHYSEESLKVNYRYYKKLFGIINLKKKKIKNNIFYFARKILNNKMPINEWGKPQHDLIKNKILKKYKFQNIPFYKMNTYKATQFIVTKIKKNPNYLVKFIKLS